MTMMYLRVIPKILLGLALLLITSLSTAKAVTAAQATEPQTTSHTTNAEKIPVANRLMPYKARYQAEFSNLPVEVTRELKKTSDKNYRLLFQAEALISTIEEGSDFQLSENQQIIPLTYKYSRAGLGDNKDQSIDYDQQKSKAHYVDHKRNVTVDLVPGILDKSTVYLQLQQDLINGKQKMSYRVLDRARIQDFAYEVTGSESLKTPLGNIDTVMVKRVRDDDTRTTVIWFAKNLGFIMVKLLQTDEGTTHTMSIAELEIDGKNISGDKI